MVDGICNSQSAISNKSLNSLGVFMKKTRSWSRTDTTNTNPNPNPNQNSLFTKKLDRKRKQKLNNTDKRITAFQILNYYTFF